MTAPTNDGEYLREANAQREHELALEKVAADTRKELARLATQRASERRTWWGYFFVGLLALTIIAVIVGALLRNADDDHRKKAEVAKVCVQGGNIWLNGNCLIARK